jgi:inner membrane protein
MDNITHTLSGVLLSRAGLNRISPHATLLLVLAVNVADLDVLAGFTGPTGYLRYHRGPTHSLVAMPLLALLVVALVRLFRRKNFSWGRAFWVALIGVASNPLFDLTNTYGVRLLWPFSDQWFNADFIAIVDVWIWVLFGVGLAAPWLSGLVSREIGARPSPPHRAAIVVLCLLAVYGFGRFLLHQRAVAVLDSRMYQGEAPLRVAAMPAPANPFRWVGLVEGRAFMEMHPDMNLLEEFDPSGGALYYKPESRAAIVRASQTQAFRVFTAFSQWPAWSVTPVADPEGAVMVKAADLRFGPPESSHFAAAAVVDAGGNVLRSSLVH